MNDHWKGEHFIRRKPTAAERKSAGCSAMASTIAEQNRRKGKKPACQRQHDRFVVGVFAQMHQIIRLETVAKRN